MNQWSYWFQPNSQSESFRLRIYPDSLGLKILRLIQTKFAMQISANKLKIGMVRIGNSLIDPSPILNPNHFGLEFSPIHSDWKFLDGFKPNFISESIQINPKSEWIGLKIFRLIQTEFSIWISPNKSSPNNSGWKFSDCSETELSIRISPNEFEARMIRIENFVKINPSIDSLGTIVNDSD